MKKLKEKLRNLYSVHDIEDKPIGLILATNPVEAKKIWSNPENHELIFATKNQMSKVRFKEIKKGFIPNIFNKLLSERRIKPHQSLLCTKLARYYNL